jgi:hypothetical protein
MLLITFTLSLLAIYAGMKLMAQSKKESLGVIYSLVSWFILIVGFMIIGCAGCRALRHCRMCSGNNVCKTQGTILTPDSVHIPPKWMIGNLLSPEAYISSDSVHIPPIHPKLQGVLLNKAYLISLSPEQLSGLVTSDYFIGLEAKPGILALSDSVHIPPKPQIPQISGFIEKY